VPKTFYFYFYFFTGQTAVSPMVGLRISLGTLSWVQTRCTNKKKTYPWGCILYENKV